MTEPDLNLRLQALAAEANAVAALLEPVVKIPGALHRSTSEETHGELRAVHTEALELAKAINGYLARDQS